MNKSVLISLFCILFLASSAYAYLDPGTGGIILQSLWTLIVALFIAAGAFFAKYFLNPIKKLFSKIFKKK
jgi:hypothetical protein